MANPTRRSHAIALPAGFCSFSTVCLSVATEGSFLILIRGEYA
jgi:hypothetical protein